MQKIIRCSWAGEDPDYCKYHDSEWGVPVHDDKKLFEMLILEGFQAGLSWITILKKRENFKKAFANWDWKKVAKFSDKEVNDLMENPGIIRNRLKISSAVKNALCFSEVRKEFGSFDTYIWRFTDHKTIYPDSPPERLSDLPVKSEISDLMSKDLKKRGFNFVGSVICYSFMQAVGMVNDHTRHCIKFTKKPH